MEQGKKAWKKPELYSLGVENTANTQGASGSDGGGWGANPSAS